MKPLLLLAGTAILYACNSHIGTKIDPNSADTSKQVTAVDAYYSKMVQDSLASSAIGTVSNGSLENAYLLPFSGENYQYFDSTSYIEGRAFCHSKVAATLVESYSKMGEDQRIFRLMECSNQHGGKIFPHRTHQNGLSVDFMMPLIMDDKIYDELDDYGSRHYLLEFNENGEWSENEKVKIDFDLVAKHILTLDQEARKNGLHIKKVIINTDLKDELYGTPNGLKLKNSGIYVVRNLTPLINLVHDDHYHIDFAKL